MIKSQVYCFFDSHCSFPMMLGVTVSVVTAASAADVTGSDSPYAVHKMMQLSEKVRPCDPKKRGAVIPTQALSRNTARYTRAVASSSPRQLRHRVPLAPTIELSPESSSVSSVSSTRKSASPKTGIGLNNFCDFL